jgi:hypothetical protein
MTDLSPSRTGLLAQTPWRSPGSRAHCFLTCAGSSTTPSPAATRDLSQLAGLAFPQAPKGRHSDITFRSSITLPASTSVYASLSLLTVTQARLKAGMKSLLLFRRALSSPTMCRFIPALGAPGFGAAEGAAIPGSMTDGRSPSMSLASVAAESHTNSAIPQRLSVRILWTAIALLFDHRERTRATAVTT